MKQLAQVFVLSFSYGDGTGSQVYRVYSDGEAAARDAALLNLHSTGTWKVDSVDWVVV